LLCPLESGGGLAFSKTNSESVIKYQKKELVCETGQKKARRINNKKLCSGKHIVF